MTVVETTCEVKPKETHLGKGFRRIISGAMAGLREGSTGQEAEDGIVATPAIKVNQGQLLFFYIAYQFVIVTD